MTANFTRQTSLLQPRFFQPSSLVTTEAWEDSEPAAGIVSTAPTGSAFSGCRSGHMSRSSHRTFSTASLKRADAIFKGAYDPETDTVTADGFFDPDELLTVTFSYQKDEEGRRVVWTENGVSTPLEYSYRVD